MLNTPLSVSKSRHLEVDLKKLVCVSFFIPHLAICTLDETRV